MAKRHGKKDEKKKLSKEELIAKQNEALEELYPDKGSWSDIEESKTQTQTIPLIWKDKRFDIECRMISWGETNQITEEIALELGTDPSPILYQRRKQELMLHRMIVKIADIPMQNAQGDPIDANWMKIPGPMGEQLRTMFFQNTGEITSQLLEGTKADNLKMIKNIIDELVDEHGNQKPDGKHVKEDNAVKK